MAYNALNNLIDAYIYANGVQAITGQILNGVLKQMVSQLGSGYHLMGVADPETVPASNDYAMAYFAATAGEYTDFGGITLAAGEVAVLLTSGNGSWSKQTIYNVPTTTEDLENTANFITNAVTDLVNYYTKSEIDTTLADYPTLEGLATALADYYDKTEVKTLISSAGNGEDIDSNPAGKLQFANRVYNAQQPNGMGYKILRKDATFAAQVTDTNTIYEIRYNFNLGGASVTIPAGCVLRFDGGKVSNGTINFGNTIIDADDVVVFDGVTVANCTSNQKVNTIWFGMTPSNADNSQILQMLVDKFVSVFINDGSYTCLSEIEISSSSRILYLSCNKTLLISYTTTLNFPQSNGFVVKKRIEICGVDLVGVRGTYNSETGLYEGGHIGIDCRTACVIKNASISTFDIGIDTENGSLVTATFENITIQHCGNIGFNFVSNGQNVNNNCTLKKLYCVRTGYNSEQDTAPSTELVSGHGLLIWGGNGNTVLDSVFEYNSGCGVYVKRPTDTAVLRGLSVTGNYFEHNKYANLFVDFSTSSPSRLGNTFIKGNFYTDAGISLPSNILKNRSCSVIDDFGTMYRDNSVLEKADKSIYLKYGEGCPLWDSDMMTNYNTDMPYYDSASGSFIFDSSKVASPYIYLNFLRATLKRGVYCLFLYLKGSGLNDRVMTSAMYINGQRITHNQTIFRFWNSFEYQQMSPVFFIPEEGGTFTLDTLQVSSLDSGDTVEVKKMILRKYDALTTSQIDTLITSPWNGMTIFDSTRGKEILWNGTAWVNMDGTALQ